MARKKGNLEVAWYLNGKKRPFMYTTIADYEMVEDMAKRFGGGYIELIPIPRIEGLVFGTWIAPITRIQEDYLEYRISKKRNKKYRPTNYLEQNKLLEGWWNMIDDLKLRTDVYMTFHKVRNNRCRFDDKTKTWLYNEGLNSHSIEALVNKLNEYYRLYYDDCINKLREHNQNIVDKWEKELNVLYTEFNQTLQ